MHCSVANINLLNGAKPAQKMEIMTCTISFMLVIVSYLNASAVFITQMRFVDFMLFLTYMENISTLTRRVKRQN